MLVLLLSMHGLFCHRGLGTSEMDVAGPKGCAGTESENREGERDVAWDVM